MWFWLLYLASLKRLKIIYSCRSRRISPQKVTMTFIEKKEDPDFLEKFWVDDNIRKYKSILSYMLFMQVIVMRGDRYKNQFHFCGFYRYGNSANYSQTA